MLGLKHDRVDWEGSCEVGASSGRGGLFADENPTIAHNTIQSSSAERENIKSSWNITLPELALIHENRKRYAENKRYVTNLLHLYELQM